MEAPNATYREAKSMPIATSHPAKAKAAPAARADVPFPVMESTSTSIFSLEASRLIVGSRLDFFWLSALRLLTVNFPYLAHPSSEL